LTLEEVLWSEVLNKMREEMKVFFSSKTSSLKVWRHRLGKIHLKLNPAYNVYNPVN
jgi:hypothetical protein